MLDFRGRGEGDVECAAEMFEEVCYGEDGPDALFCRSVLVSEAGLLGDKYLECLDERFNVIEICRNHLGTLGCECLS